MLRRRQSTAYLGLTTCQDQPRPRSWGGRPDYVAAVAVAAVVASAAAFAGLRGATAAAGSQGSTAARCVRGYARTQPRGGS